MMIAKVDRFRLTPPCVSCYLLVLVLEEKRREEKRGDEKGRKTKRKGRAGKRREETRRERGGQEKEREERREEQRRGLGLILCGSVCTIWYGSDCLF